MLYWGETPSPCMPPLSTTGRPIPMRAAKQRGEMLEPSRAALLQNLRKVPPRTHAAALSFLCSSSYLSESLGLAQGKP